MSSRPTQSDLQSLLRRDDDGAPLTYRLRRSGRRTLALHVRRGRLEVRAPFTTPVSAIEAFVDKHRDWIRRKLARQARQEAQRLCIADGMPIFYQAREYRLRFVAQSRSAVWLDGRRLCIGGRALDEDRAARILADWLRRRARDFLPARSHALARYLGVGERLKAVVFRKTRSKWGHCTSEGRIQYNWLLMLAPDAVIDYMVCHEVCHLIHMNHSREYWQLVESLCPDYRRYVGWLREHEHRLWF